MNELLFNILEVVIISAIVAVLRYVIPYFVVILREHDYNFAADIIETAVRAAEQTIVGHGRGDEKFQMVVGFVREQLDRYGVGITEEQIVQLIEAAVQAMNAEVIATEAKTEGVNDGGNSKGDDADDQI